MIARGDESSKMPSMTGGAGGKNINPLERGNNNSVEAFMAFPSTLWTIFQNV